MTGRRIHTGTLTKHVPPSLFHVLQIEAMAEGKATCYRDLLRFEIRSVVVVVEFVAGRQYEDRLSTSFLEVVLGGSPTLLPAAVAFVEQLVAKVQHSEWGGLPLRCDVLCRKCLQKSEVQCLQRCLFPLEEPVLYWRGGVHFFTRLECLKSEGPFCCGMAPKEVFSAAFLLGNEVQPDGPRVGPSCELGAVAAESPSVVFSVRYEKDQNSVTKQPHAVMTAQERLMGRLALQLEKHGVSSWSGRLIRAANGSWDCQYASRLEKCKVFVPLLTRDYFESSACAMEFQWGTTGVRSFLLVRCDNFIAPGNVNDLPGVDLAKVRLNFEIGHYGNYVDFFQTDEEIKIEVFVATVLGLLGLPTDSAKPQLQSSPSPRSNPSPSSGPSLSRTPSPSISNEAQPQLGQPQYMLDQLLPQHHQPQCMLFQLLPQPHQPQAMLDQPAIPQPHQLHSMPSQAVTQPHQPHSMPYEQAHQPQPEPLSKSHQPQPEPLSKSHLSQPQHDSMCVFQSAPARQRANSESFRGGREPRVQAECRPRATSTGSMADEGRSQPILRGSARWVPDSHVTACKHCATVFTFFRRRHHCRRCGYIFCGKCSSHRQSIGGMRVRVCFLCNETKFGKL